MWPGFSGVVNLLMLAGSLYMLQMYDPGLEQPGVPTLVAFLVGVHENLASPDAVLDQFRILRDRHGMRSMTMAAVADEVLHAHGRGGLLTCVRAPPVASPRASALLGSPPRRDR